MEGVAGEERRNRKEFYFKTDIIPEIVKEIQKAESFIKIAIFQMHDERIFKALEQKLPGVKIEIMTLPYDSIHNRVYKEVVERFSKLERKGAEVKFIPWNVGDPERTTTAVGRWYSYHGKFMATDKAAIGLSANFTEAAELDAMIIFREQGRIEQFLGKFEQLEERFVRKTNGDFGTIKSEILRYNYERVTSGEVFELPDSIATSFKDIWIKDYPPEMCPEEIPKSDGLYITPFDCRGRTLFEALISSTQKCLYLSTESFTDNEILNSLRSAKIRGVDIKILTGYKSMDFPLRVQQNLLMLLGFGIEVRNPEEELHAKLLMSDEYLMISSINLNKINLGFKFNRFWRENTESFYLCSDPEIIQLAKTRFLEVFNTADDVFEGIAGKNKFQIGQIIARTHNFRSSDRAKLALSKIKLEKSLQADNEFQTILRDAIDFAKKRSSNRVDLEDIEQALEKNKG